MWPFVSSSSVEELDRARRACEMKRSALEQCERAQKSGAKSCEGLARDHDYCRASRLKACSSAAEEFDKCARRRVNWKGAVIDAPTCEPELRAMRRCLRARWRSA